MPVQIKGVGSISGLDQGIVVGIATATNFKTGSSNLHSTGLTVGNNFLHSTGINVGTGATIHVPATNTLTFGTNSNEIVRIDSSGNLGINVTSPTHPLDVHTSGTEIARFQGANGARLKLRNATNNIFLAYTDTSDIFQLGTNGQNPRVHVAVNGNVGLNETNPGHKLTVGGDGYFGFTTPNDAARQIIFNANRGSAGDTLANINWQWNSKNVAQIRGIAGSDTTNKDDGHLAFFTSAANSLVERLRIKSDGNVGIGTDSPTYPLQVHNSSSYLRLLSGHESDYDLRFMTQNGEANIWHYGTDDFVIGTRYDRKFHLQQNAGKRLTIMGNGKVGINSTTPVRTMDIRPQAGATNSDLALTANSDSGFSQLIFAKPGDGYRGGVFYDFSEDQMKIHAGSSQIDMVEFGGPSAYMGVGNDIGNSSNDGSWNARFNLYGTQHAKMEIHQNVNDVRSHWWCHSGHLQAYIGTRSNHDFVFETNNQIRARLTNQGAFHLFDGVYNYIESADYRIFNNTSISNGYTGAIRTVARYNTNTSLFSHSETGGTGGASRWTFGKNCYCLLTVSQDVNGNTDTGYWWMGPKINNNFIGRHLVRKTSEWDMMTWQQSFQVSANDYLEIAWGSTSGLTAVDGTDWSHYNFIIWENK